MIVGWDGLGLVSFCLVVYYANSSRLSSGLLTVFMNRVGDSFFLLSFYYYFLRGFFFDWVCLGREAVVVSLVFFVGCATKSAQIPFSS